MKNFMAIFCMLGLSAFSFWVQPMFANADEPSQYTNASPADGDTFNIQGTVVRMVIEGGFFAVKSDDGKTFEPINLPDSFKRDGMKVSVTARIRRDMGSIHMVGDIIEILQITAR